MKYPFIEVDVLPNRYKHGKVYDCACVRIEDIDTFLDKTNRVMGKQYVLYLKSELNRIIVQQFLTAQSAKVMYQHEAFVLFHGNLDKKLFHAFIRPLLKEISCCLKDDVKISYGLLKVVLLKRNAEQRMFTSVPKNIEAILESEEYLEGLETMEFQQETIHTKYFLTYEEFTRQPVEEEPQEEIYASTKQEIETIKKEQMEKEVIAMVCPSAYRTMLIQKYNQDQFVFQPWEKEKTYNAILCEESCGLNTIKEVVEACKNKNMKLIFLGSDQVYEDKKGTPPFKEEEFPVVYSEIGQQQLEMETYIKEYLKEYCILRCAMVLGFGEPNVMVEDNLMTQVFQAIWKKEILKISNQERKGMVYAKHLSTQWKQILELESGVYHFSSKNDVTTYECARYIAQQMKVKEEVIDQFIQVITTDQQKDYRLNTKKIEGKGIVVASFEEDVRQCLKDYGWEIE